ncbi:hypothetical protein SUGI_0076110 [Cryptomeria japonica]|nr:hypothetical protein SUGI_0076110 [Cryptomeria japonica]
MVVAGVGPSLFEVELDAIRFASVMFGKMKLSLMAMVLGAMPIPVIMVLKVMPSMMVILVGDATRVNPSPIEVELGVIVDVGTY